MPSLLPRLPKNNRYSVDDPDEYRLTLIEHLEELRDRIVRSVIAIVVGTIAGWFLQPFVYNTIEGMAKSAISKALGPKHVQVNFVFHSATDPFMLKIGERLALVLNERWPMDKHIRANSIKNVVRSHEVKNAAVILCIGCYLPKRPKSRRDFIVKLLSLPSVSLLRLFIAVPLRNERRRDAGKEKYHKVCV